MITPGPWSAGKPQWRRCGPPYKIPITCQEGVVANVISHDRVNWGNTRNLRPSDDANLIAAAPKMLEVLEKLTNSIEYYEACRKPQEEWDEYDTAVFPVWLEARDLIVELRRREHNEAT